MKKNEIIIFIFYSIYSLIFLIVTTNYLTLNDIIYKANQSDSFEYSEIAKNFPRLIENSNIIDPHKAQRFLIHYIIGGVSYFSNLDIFLTYKIITYAIAIITIFFLYFLSKKLNLELRSLIIFFSFFFFNPYTIRYQFFNPAQSHDIIFLLIGFIFFYSIIFNKKINIIIYSYCSMFLRQTSIALIIGSILFFLLQKKRDKKIFIFFYIIGFLIILFFLIFIGKYSSQNKFPFIIAYGIFLDDFNNFGQLIKYLLAPLLSFLPLIFFIFGKRKSIKINKKKIVILLFVCSIIIGQPILTGTAIGGNVIRLSTLCFPILLSIIFYIFDFKEILKKRIYFLFLILFFHIWSLHPTFSKIIIFDSLRFFN
jgi:hypothetical protein